MILNPNKTKALVVFRSRTVNPPNDDLVLSEFPFVLSDILGVKFYSRLTFEDHMCVVLSPVSLKELVF